jgi:asparagine synthase (glutamine-hydrolysing)
VLREAYALAPEAPLWSRISFAEARGYMHDVLLRDTDQTSMAHALEVRVPLLDHRLASHVLSLPDAAKRDGHTPKALLVKSLEYPLPDDIVSRPKRGFTLPFDTWMRGALRSFCEQQLGESGLDGRGLLQPGAAKGLWEDFLSRRRGVTWSRVWTLVALNAWLDRQGIRAPVPVQS